jgi:hypothetical protein
LNDEYDSDNNSEYKYNVNNKENKEIDLKIVDSLYDYFVDKGLSDEPQIRCMPQNWRIEKHHIYAALIRNKGDITKAGREIDEMINNDSFEIRTFYAKLKYGEYIHPKTHQIYKKPYLSDQEWQTNPKKGMHLLNKNKVYKISEVYSYTIQLDRILTKDYYYMTINLKDSDVKYGEFKLIDSKNLDEYLKKEYCHMKYELQKLSEKETKFSDSIYTKIQKIRDIINAVNKEHKDNCTYEAKILAINFTKIPIYLVQKIKSYGIESNCNHMFRISYLQEDIDYLYDCLNDGYEPYENLKWKIQVAKHVIEGDYEEWLDDYFYW